MHFQKWDTKKPQINQTQEKPIRQEKTQTKQKPKPPQTYYHMIIRTHNIIVI